MIGGAEVIQWRTAAAAQRHVDGCFVTAERFLAVCDRAIALEEALQQCEEARVAAILRAPEAAGR